VNRNAAVTYSAQRGGKTSAVPDDWVVFSVSGYGFREGADQEKQPLFRVRKRGWADRFTETRAFGCLLRVC
jgi:hypothetical protein